ncbi:hypothetical protein ACFLX8_04930 [Chloroflexota bacterium]
MAIAEARTVLQMNCYRILDSHRTPVWFLDDDVRFDIPLDRGDHIDWNFIPDHIGWIADLSKTDADVVIGGVSGDPPVPIQATIRTQVVDLYHNLELFSSLGSSQNGHKLNQEFEPRHQENMVLRAQHSDYYYDLSRIDYGHLERPFWYVPQDKGITVAEAFKEMISVLPSIFSGCQVFRPILWNTADPKSNLSLGYNRGPNTLVFRPECLTEMPNISPVLADRHTRRSDMNWALLGSNVQDWRLFTAPFPVRQDRSLLSPLDTRDYTDLVDDIRGYAAFSALSDIISQKNGTQQSNSLDKVGIDILSFSNDEISLLIKNTEHYISERMFTWEMNYLRVRALAFALDSFTDHFSSVDQGARHFWLVDSSFKQEVEILSSFIERLKKIYTGPVKEVTELVSAFDRHDLEQYFKNLGNNIRGYIG